MSKSIFFCIKKKKYQGLLEHKSFDFKQILHENLFKCSSKKVIQHVVSNAKNLESKDQNDWRAIHYACIWNNIEFVKELVEQEVDLEAMDNKKNRPIHLASRYGSKELVEILIDAGVKLECFNDQKNKPIHIAFSNKDVSVVKMLADNGSNLKSANGEGITPIHLACDLCPDSMDIEQNSILIKIVKRMIKKKVELNINCGELGNYPIHSAIQRKNYELIKLLIKSGVELEVKNALNQKPIHLVCMMPINESSTEILKILIDAEVNLECKDLEGKRPIHYACLVEEGTTFVRELSKVGVSLNKPDEFGKKPIDYAEESANIELVKYLSKKV